MALDHQRRRGIPDGIVFDACIGEYALVWPCVIDLDTAEGLGAMGVPKGGGKLDKRGRVARQRNLLSPERGSGVAQKLHTCLLGSQRGIFESYKPVRVCGRKPPLSSN